MIDEEQAGRLVAKWGSILTYEKLKAEGHIPDDQERLKKAIIIESQENWKLEDTTTATEAVSAMEERDGVD